MKTPAGTHAFAKRVLGCAILMVAVWVIVLVPRFLGHDTVLRVRSPSHRFDAVVAEISRTALTTFTHKVFVVPSGSTRRFSTPAVVLTDAILNESAYGVDVAWTAPDSLEMRYLRAQDTDVHHRVLKTRSIDLRRFSPGPCPSAHPFRRTVALGDACHRAASRLGAQSRPA